MKEKEDRVEELQTCYDAPSVTNELEKHRVYLDVGIQV